MANNVSTSALGRFIELAKQAKAGNGDLVLVLFQSTGLGTATAIRNSADLAALKTNATEATFTGYTRHVYLASDITITLNTTTFTQTLTLPLYTYNPAGGATSNTMGLGAVVYRPTAGSADSAQTPLGTFDATGSASGGTYSFTPGSLGDDA